MQSLKSKAILLATTALAFGIGGASFAQMDETTPRSSTTNPAYEQDSNRTSDSTTGTAYGDRDTGAEGTESDDDSYGDTGAMDETDRDYGNMDRSGASQPGSASESESGTMNTARSGDTGMQDEDAGAVDTADTDGQTGEESEYASFDEVNTDGNDTISREEYVSHVTGGNISESEAGEIFDVVANDDGELTREEYYTPREDVTEVVERALASAGSTQGAEPVSATGDAEMGDSGSPDET